MPSALAVARLTYVARFCKLPYRACASPEQVINGRGWAGTTPIKCEVGQKLG